MTIKGLKLLPSPGWLLWLCYPLYASMQTFDLKVWSFHRTPAVLHAQTRMWQLWRPAVYKETNDSTRGQHVTITAAAWKEETPDDRRHSEWGLPLQQPSLLNDPTLRYFHSTKSGWIGCRTHEKYCPGTDSECFRLFYCKEPHTHH